MLQNYSYHNLVKCLAISKVQTSHHETKGSKKKVKDVKNEKLKISHIINVEKEKKNFICL